MLGGEPAPPVLQRVLAQQNDSSPPHPALVPGPPSPGVLPGSCWGQDGWGTLGSPCWGLGAGGLPGAGPGCAPASGHSWLQHQGAPGGRRQGALPGWRRLSGLVGWGWAVQSSRRSAVPGGSGWSEGTKACRVRSPEEQCRAWGGRWARALCFLGLPALLPRQQADETQAWASCATLPWPQRQGPAPGSDQASSTESIWSTGP